MAWALLLVAGLCEVGWAVGLKYTDGFSKPVPTALVVGAMVASVWLLAIALRTHPHELWPDWFGPRVAEAPARRVADSADTYRQGVLT
jgi:hypothetical protein